MKKTASKDPYPLNLLKEVIIKQGVELPESITYDILAGVQYALGALTDREQQIIHLRYEERKSFAKIAEILSETKESICEQEHFALFKLRKSHWWNYMYYGIAGYMQRMEEFSYQKGYEVGYRAGVYDERSGVVGKDAALEPMKQPITKLRMSIRPYNCLKKAGINTVGEVLALDCSGIERIAGLGPVGRCEIANALKRLGIHDTEWSRYE